MLTCINPYNIASIANTGTDITDPKEQFTKFFHSIEDMIGIETDKRWNGAGDGTFDGNKKIIF